MTASHVTLFEKATKKEGNVSSQPQNKQAKLKKCKQDH
jgi:hypothetical protein